MRKLSPVNISDLKPQKNIGKKKFLMDFAPVSTPLLYPLPLTSLKRSLPAAWCVEAILKTEEVNLAPSFLPEPLLLRS